MIKIINKLINILEKILIVILGACVVIVIAQIIFRYLIGKPIGWSEQISRFLFMWTIMLGIPVIFNKNIVMTFDLLFEAFPQKVQTILGIAFDSFGLFFCGFFFRYAVAMCLEMVGRVASGVPIPLWALYACQVCCAFFLGLVFIKRIAEKSGNLKKKREV